MCPLRAQGSVLRASGRYNGVMATIWTVYEEEGLAAFWKGNVSNTVRIVPVYALRFACNDTFKHMVKRPNQSIKTLDMAQLALAGTTAGLVQQSATYPLEVSCCAPKAKNSPVTFASGALARPNANVKVEKMPGTCNFRFLIVTAIFRVLTKLWIQS